MEKSENLEEFYKRRFDWLPDNFQNEVGHFNVFELQPFVGKNAKPVPYRRRDFYKIMLVNGRGSVHYADKIIEVKKQALTFSNPHIPYKWENTEGIQSGFFCVFNRNFFRAFGNIDQYVVFQPQGDPIVELTDEQTEAVKKIYERMFQEINSEYVYKYDVLRSLALELVHFALKIQPLALVSKNKVLNASQRISALFFELLERQFPVDDLHSKIAVRTASHFAELLNIHTNHLNRALKETTQKTTTQHISERLLREAQILLKHSTWDVNQISLALGFTEVTHFNNFFKKHTKQSPLKFRKL